MSLAPLVRLVPEGGTLLTSQLHQQTLAVLFCLALPVGLSVFISEASVRMWIKMPKNRAFLLGKVNHTR